MTQGSSNQNENESHSVATSSKTIDAHLISVRLEEFRALRAEIVATMTRQGQHMNLAWTGAIALITVGSLAKIPEVASLSVLFIAASWHDYLRLSAAMVRLGAYIEICIEPKVPGLFWESTVHKIHTENAVKNSWIYRFWIACTSSYGAFGIIALGVSLGLLFTNFPTDDAHRSFSIFIISIAAFRLVQVAMIAARSPMTRGSMIELLRQVNREG